MEHGLMIAPMESFTDWLETVPKRASDHFASTGHMMNASTSELTPT